MWAFSFHCNTRHLSWRLVVVIDTFLTSKRSSVPKPLPVTSCFPAKMSLKEKAEFGKPRTAGGECSAGRSAEVSGARRRPASKIHGSEVCDSNLDKHAVLRGDWYANSLVKWLEAERLSQQPALLRGGGDSAPIDTPPLHLLWSLRCDHYFEW